MSEEKRVFIPNSFQTPNVLIDEVMRCVSGPAFKILMTINRLTLGWNPLMAVEISIDPLGEITGLSRPSVVAGAQELAKIGVLLVKKSPKNSRIPNHYALNLNLTTGELVKKLNQLKKLTSLTSKGFLPKLVNRFDSLILNTRNTIREGQAQAEPSLPLLRVVKFPKKSKPARPPESAQAAAFARFYEAYPRHEAKKPALTAWLKLNPDSALTQTIMQAVERYRENVKDEEQRYIALPATWLNKERWEDELPESQTVKEPRFVND